MKTQEQVLAALAVKEVEAARYDKPANYDEAQAYQLAQELVKRLPREMAAKVIEQLSLLTQMTHDADGHLPNATYYADAMYQAHCILTFN